MLKLRVFLLIIFITMNNKANADVFSDILGQLEQQTNLQQQIQQYTAQMPGLQQQTLQTMIGSYGYGNFNFNQNLQSWGTNTENWNQVLNDYQQGQNGIGQLAQQNNQQFPIQQNTIVNPNPQSLDAKYYTLQSQTALAARSASEYDYNNIQNQINNLQQLHDQIDSATNLKAAIDLQNRLQYESAMIQIELLRLAALSNQQQAIESQGESNAEVNNANAFQ